MTNHQKLNVVGGIVEEIIPHDVEEADGRGAHHEVEVHEGFLEVGEFTVGGVVDSVNVIAAGKLGEIGGMRQGIEEGGPNAVDKADLSLRKLWQEVPRGFRSKP